MRFPLIYFFIWAVSRFVTRFFFRMEVTGVEHIPPSGGFILASNHRSYYDPILVNTWLNRATHAFAKAELFRNPLFAYILRCTLAFPVRRGVIDRVALSKAIEVVKGGDALLMFPEGTRCRTGDFLSPKPGIGLVAMATGGPIIPTYLHGSDKLKDCLFRRDRLSISFGEPIETTGFSDDKESYMAIAEQVMASVRQMSEGVAVAKQ